VRQFAGGGGDGRSACKVFHVRVSAAAIQPDEQIQVSGEGVAGGCAECNFENRGECQGMTDFLLVAWVSALIEIRRYGWMFGIGKRWKPGEHLKILFAGYNGTRNTGSDVRVQETLRQIRHVLGAKNLDFSVMTQSFDRTKGYFEGTR